MSLFTIILVFRDKNVAQIPIYFSQISAKDAQSAYIDWLKSDFWKNLTEEARNPLLKDLLSKDYFVEAIYDHKGVWVLDITKPNLVATIVVVKTNPVP